MGQKIRNVYGIRIDRMSTFSMEAKLLMPQGASSPDTYDSQDSELPRANFVVSRTTDRCCSRMGAESGES